MFLVRTGTHYTKEDEKRLRDAINNTILDGSHIAIEYVDEIERTKNGKLRCVVSSVPAEDVVGYEVLPPPSLSALKSDGVDL